jgi:hypothetical protein
MLSGLFPVGERKMRQDFHLVRFRTNREWTCRRPLGLRHSFGHAVVPNRRPAAPRCERSAQGSRRGHRQSRELIRETYMPTAQGGAKLLANYSVEQLATIRRFLEETRDLQQRMTEKLVEREKTRSPG